MSGYYTRLALDAGLTAPLTVRGVVEQAVQAPTPARLRSVAVILQVAEETLSLTEEQEELLLDLRAIIAVERKWLFRWERKHGPSPLS